MNYKLLMKIRILVLICIFCLGCSRVEPRRPIAPKPSTTILKETINQTKKLNKIEDEKIQAIIKRDSTTNYLLSPNGFWYTYINKIEDKKKTPKAGDVVQIEYNISDLDDTIIYAKEELGQKTFKIDKEDFISALHFGIQLMKEGETITFVIPSYNAFGVTGDEHKIGMNQSIKSTVTLIKIN